MKLPLILSAMIAALAIPGSLAEDATTDETKTTEAAPEATEEHHDSKHTAKPHKGKHHKGKHHKHRHHGGHHPHHTGNSPHGPYRGSWDDMQLRAADGDVNRDLSPQAGAHVDPGHKAP